MAEDVLFEVVVSPPEGTTGANLVRVLEAINICARAAEVFVADIECNGDRRWVGRPTFQTTSAKVIEYAGRVGQFDWATFFFFHESVGRSVQRTDYNTLFSHAMLVVRAVDDTDFLVYTSKMEDAQCLSRFFPVKYARKRRNDVSHPA